MGSLPSASNYKPPLSVKQKKLNATYLAFHYFRIHGENTYNLNIPKEIIKVCIEILLTIELPEEDAKHDPYGNIMIYNSQEQRGTCYSRCRILWCKCCEPDQFFTTKYIQEHRWDGCTKVGDAMSVDSISRIERKQNCCDKCLSCTPCCCCIVDIGDIHLWDPEDSYLQNNAWILKGIMYSTQTYENMDYYLQNKQARNQKD